MSNLIRFRVRKKGLELTTISVDEVIEKALNGFKSVSDEKEMAFLRTLNRPGLSPGEEIHLDGEDGSVTVRVESVPPISALSSFKSLKSNE